MKTVSSMLRKEANVLPSQTSGEICPKSIRVTSYTLNHKKDSFYRLTQQRRKTNNGFSGFSKCPVHCSLRFEDTTCPETALKARVKHLLNHTGQPRKMKSCAPGLCDTGVSVTVVQRLPIR